MAKKWYTSKTIWYNVAMTVVTAANELMPVLEVMDPTVASQVRVWLVLALSLGNIVLRTVTVSPVKL